MAIQIHGKSYVTVSERLAAMHASGKSFEMVSSEPLTVGERVIWRVAILVDSKMYFGSAECHLNAKPGSADATDPFACGETSAIGRALAMAGVLSFEGIASADEIVRVQPQATNGNGRLASIKRQVRQLGLASNPQEWASWKVAVLGDDVADSELTEACLDTMQETLDLRPD